MNLFKKIRLKLDLIKLSIANIDKWIIKHETDKLEYALKQGTWGIRAHAILGLCTLKSTKSIPLITKSIDDPIKPVSKAAISAIEKLTTDPELITRIEQKKQFWKIKELKERELANHFLDNNNTNNYKWDRPSKETLENVKQMLRKPMVGGKWL